MIHRLWKWYNKLGNLYKTVKCTILKNNINVIQSFFFRFINFLKIIKKNQNQIKKRVMNMKLFKEFNSMLFTI